MINLHPPVWATGALAGARPIAISLGLAGSGMALGYLGSHALSSKGDFMHPTAWGTGAAESAVLIGVPAMALALGGPMLANRSGAAALKGAAEYARVLTENPGKSKEALKLTEDAAATFAATADKSRGLGKVGSIAGVAGVGGVIGTSWALVVTEGRLDKPDLHVSVDQTVTTRSETTTSRAGREVGDAGKAAGGVWDSVSGWFK